MTDPDALSSIAATNDQIIMALIALVATSVAALVWVIRNGRTVRVAAEEATAANHAVNGIGPDAEHRIWNKVDRIELTGQRLEEAVDRLLVKQEQFEQHGWANLPPDLSNGVELTLTIRELQDGMRQNTIDHAAIIKRLDSL